MAPTGLKTGGCWFAYSALKPSGNLRGFGHSLPYTKLEIQRLPWEVSSLYNFRMKENVNKDAWLDYFMNKTGLRTKADPPPHFCRRR